MWKNLIIIAALLLGFAKLSTTKCPTNEPKVICYYSSWAYYRSEYGFFNSEHINPLLCTHIVYTFAGLNLGFGIDSLDPNVDLNHGGYKNLTILKEVNPCLKNILSVGGWNEGSRKYSVMVQTEGSRSAFVESVLRFIVTFNFDGIDLDWEYPTARGGIPVDRKNFVLLLKNLHERLSIWNLSVSIAVPMLPDILGQGYNVPQISKYVDFVSIMAYDYTSTNSPVTGLLAPISQIKISVQHWLDGGLPPEKLILGVASYARTHKLQIREANAVGAPTNGTGRIGIYTKEPGFLAYYELRKLLETGFFRTKCLENELTCYANFDLDWFSFDTDEMISAKIRYAMKEKQLGGMMIWTIDTDDFRGLYGPKFTLLHVINNNIKNLKKQA